MMPPLDAHCIPFDASAIVAYTLGAICVTRANSLSIKAAGSRCCVAAVAAIAVHRNWRLSILLNSPPKLGGVPASLSEQAGWFRRHILHAFPFGNHPASLRSAPLLT